MLQEFPKSFTRYVHCLVSRRVPHRGPSSISHQSYFSIDARARSSISAPAYGLHVSGLLTHVNGSKRTVFRHSLVLISRAPT